MISFDTTKKYVLIRHPWGKAVEDGGTIPITFSDSEDELASFCRGMGWAYNNIGPDNDGMYSIAIETREFVKEMNSYLNDEYTKRSLERIYRYQKNQPIDDGLNINNLNVGDEFTIPHDVYGDIPFIVIGKNHDAPNTSTILSKEIIELLPFDAKEANNSSANRKSYGNNRYLYGNLLQWMNSDAEAGQWYTAQHPADASPTSDNVWNNYNPYADKAGFLHGFSDDFKRQLVTVNKTTAKNTKTDGGGSETVSSKAFLLSTTEVGLANENNIAEGTIYEYFSKNNTDAQRVAYPSTYCLNNAGGYTNTNFAEGKGWHYWLRTPDSGTSYRERLVHTSGALTSANAYAGGIGLRVGLTITNQ